MGFHVLSAPRTLTFGVSKAGDKYLLSRTDLRAGARQAPRDLALLYTHTILPGELMLLTLLEVGSISTRLVLQFRSLGRERPSSVNAICSPLQPIISYLRTWFHETAIMI